MADTTIKVSSEVRDRLAVLAAEQGTTIRDLVSQLAAATETRAELRQRQDQAVAYIRANLRPDFDVLDVAAGHQIWDALPVSLPAISGQVGEADGDGGRAA